MCIAVTTTWINSRGHQEGILPTTLPGLHPRETQQGQQAHLGPQTSPAITSSPTTTSDQSFPNNTFPP